jgi:hypothetical protein
MRQPEMQSSTVFYLHSGPVQKQSFLPQTVGQKRNRLRILLCCCSRSRPLAKDDDADERKIVANDPSLSTYLFCHIPDIHEDAQQARLHLEGVITCWLNAGIVQLDISSAAGMDRGYLTLHGQSRKISASKRGQDFG